MTKYMPSTKGVLTPQDKETLEHLLARGWQHGSVVEVQESYVSYDGFNCILISWGQHKSDWAGVRDNGFVEEVTMANLTDDDAIKAEALDVTAQCLAKYPIEVATGMLHNFYFALDNVFSVSDRKDEEQIVHYLACLTMAKEKCLGICS